MMTKTDYLIDYLNQLLHPQLFSDYCPNGLQIAGKNEINTIISGVTACQALLEEAVKKDADLILVHHGYFWKDENPCIVGMKQKRLATLLKNNINLAAYHLPLDAHPIYGNNVQLADQLNIIVDGEFPEKNGMAIGKIGRLQNEMTGAQFSKSIAHTLRRDPLYIQGQSPVIRSIAWCTGAAQDYIYQAIDVGVDAFLTGEVSERTTHIARENGIHFYAAGHHATERYGVMALGEHLAEKFGINHEFIDIENPV